MGNTPGPYMVSLLEKQSAFIPVTLTLETQAEVDAIYAVFNHRTLLTTLRLTLEDYEALEPYYENSLFDKLDNLLKSAKQ